MLATLLLRGHADVLAGDEFGRTQGGNNNAYAQDNAITWLDWEGITPVGRSLLEFTRKLIAVRKAYPITIAAALSFADTTRSSTSKM